MSLLIKSFSPIEVVQEIKNINPYETLDYELMAGKVVR
jgi:hypothetical protein